MSEAANHPNNDPHSRGIRRTARISVADGLPVVPWDTLRGAKERAQEHPGGIVNLSVGTPVDPVAPLIREAAASVSGISGYPTVHGTQELRESAVQSLSRRYNTIPLDPDSQILPVIGTKELISLLPSQLGLGSSDLVVIPELAYPSYEIGARLAHSRFTRADGTVQLGPSRPSLIFLNSPCNPTGKILGVDHLRKVVSWARERDCIVAADECYIGLCWEGESPSILDPRVCDGDTTGLLSIQSLSKSSNMASYRAGFVAGDPDLLEELLKIRKHSGFIVPLMVQAAMAAAMNDDEHEAAQKEIYRARRSKLRSALKSTGFTIEQSEGGLYLWVTAGVNGRELVDWFAERGILVTPGDFYGPRGTDYVRIAITATDERIETAVQRLRDE